MQYWAQLIFKQINSTCISTSIVKSNARNFFCNIILIKNMDHIVIFIFTTTMLVLIQVLLICLKINCAQYWMEDYFMVVVYVISLIWLSKMDYQELMIKYLKLERQWSIVLQRLLVYKHFYHFVKQIVLILVNSKLILKPVRILLILW